MRATVKLLGCTTLFTATYVTLAVVVGRRRGPLAGLAAFAAGPLAGYTTVLFTERLRRAGGMRRARRALADRRGVLAGLAARRDEIVEHAPRTSSEPSRGQTRLSWPTRPPTRFAAMLRTSDQCRAALQDGREVYYRGRRIPDVLAEPELRVAIDHAAIDFDLAHDGANRDLVVAKDPESGGDISAYYRIPRNSDDLLARSKLIETVTAAGGTMVTLIKEIGTDAMFALQRVLDGEEPASGLRRFYQHCRRRTTSPSRSPRPT